MKKAISVFVLLLVTISSVKLISLTQPPDKNNCEISSYQNKNGDYVFYKIDGEEFAKLNEQMGYRYSDELETKHTFDVASKKFKLFYLGSKTFQKYQNNDEGVFVEDLKPETFLEWRGGTYYRTDLEIPKLNLSEIDCLYLSSENSSKEKTLKDKEILTDILNCIKSDEWEHFPIKKLSSYFGDSDKIYVSLKFKNHTKLFFYVGNWTLKNGKVVESDHCSWE